MCLSGQHAAPVHGHEDQMDVQGGNHVPAPAIAFIGCHRPMAYARRLAARPARRPVTAPAGPLPPAGGVAGPRAGQAPDLPQRPVQVPRVRDLFAGRPDREGLDSLRVMQNPVNYWPADPCPKFTGKLATRRVR